jgi:hypothetical protein
LEIHQGAAGNSRFRELGTKIMTTVLSVQKECVNPVLSLLLQDLPMRVKYMREVDQMQNLVLRRGLGPTV